MTGRELPQYDAEMDEMCRADIIEKAMAVLGDADAKARIEDRDQRILHGAVRFYLHRLGVDPAKYDRWRAAEAAVEAAKRFREMESRIQASERYCYTDHSLRDWHSGDQELARAIRKAAAELGVSAPPVRRLRPTSVRAVATIKRPRRILGLFRKAGTIYVLDELDPYLQAEVAGHEVRHYAQGVLGLEVDEEDAAAFGERFARRFCHAVAA